MKYLFIAQHKKTWPVDVMCQLLGVTRSGFYRFNKLKQHKPDDDPVELEAIDWIRKIAEETNFTYGSRRMRKALNALGFPFGRRRTKTLMRKANVFVRYRRKYKVTTNSNHKQPVFENILNRQFQVDKPNQAYVSDITYIWTNEGWLYLTVMIDLFSRKVVGWDMSNRMKAVTVCNALTMAVWQRRAGAGLIVHSDRGSQYASKKYRQLLQKHQFIGSMSRKGDCWDNSVAESFFARLKSERVSWKNYQTRWEAKQDILNYITMFYNNRRLHSFLGYKSPNQFECEYIDEIKKVA